MYSMLTFQRGGLGPTPGSATAFGSYAVYHVGDVANMFAFRENVTYVNFVPATGLFPSAIFSNQVLNALIYLKTLPIAMKNNNSIDILFFGTTDFRQLRETLVEFVAYGMVPKARFISAYSPTNAFPTYESLIQLIQSNGGIDGDMWKGLYNQYVLPMKQQIDNGTIIPFVSTTPSLQTIFNAAPNAPRDTWCELFSIINANHCAVCPVGSICPSCKTCNATIV